MCDMETTVRAGPRRDNGTRLWLALVPRVTLEPAFADSADANARGLYEQLSSSEKKDLARAGRHACSCRWRVVRHCMLPARPGGEAGSCPGQCGYLSTPA